MSRNIFSFSPYKFFLGGLMTLVLPLLISLLISLWTLVWDGLETHMINGTSFI